MRLTHKLSRIQLELLKIYSFNPSEKDLLAIKSLLGRYFAQKLTRSVDKVVGKKGLTQGDMDSWLNEENQ